MKTRKGNLPANISIAKNLSLLEKHELPFDKENLEKFQYNMIRKYITSKNYSFASFQKSLMDHPHEKAIVLFVVSYVMDEERRKSSYANYAFAEDFRKHYTKLLSETMYTDGNLQKDLSDNDDLRNVYEFICMVLFKSGLFLGLSATVLIVRFVSRFNIKVNIKALIRQFERFDRIEASEFCTKLVKFVKEDELYNSYIRYKRNNKKHNC